MLPTRSGMDSWPAWRKVIAFFETEDGDIDHLWMLLVLSGVVLMGSVAGWVLRGADGNLPTAAVWAGGLFGTAFVTYFIRGIARSLKRIKDGWDAEQDRPEDRKGLGETH